MGDQSETPQFQVGDWVTITGGDPTDGYKIIAVETPAEYEPFYQLEELQIMFRESKLSPFAVGLPDHCCDEKGSFPVFKVQGWTGRVRAENKNMSTVNTMRYSERAFRRGFCHGLQRCIDALCDGAEIDDLIGWANKYVDPWRESLSDDPTEWPPEFCQWRERQQGNSAAYDATPNESADRVRIDNLQALSDGESILLSRGQVAALLGILETDVILLHQCGALTPMRMGRSKRSHYYRWRGRDVWQYLTRCVQLVSEAQIEKFSTGKKIIE